MPPTVNCFLARLTIILRFAPNYTDYFVQSNHGYPAASDTVTDYNYDKLGHA